MYFSRLSVTTFSTKLISPANVRTLIAYNGIIVLNVSRSLNAQEIDHEKGQQLVMCSDGLKSKWDTVGYPAIQRYKLSILCASLLKDFARYTDDMSAAVCKINFDHA